MDQREGWKPFIPDIEYVDEAGYPDGVGTLDEGTAKVDGAATRSQDADNVEDDIASFLEE
jgi:hypothetical protein